MTLDEAARLLGVNLDDVAPRTIGTAYEARDQDVKARLDLSTSPLQQAKYREIRERLASARAVLLGSPAPTRSPTPAPPLNVIELPDLPAQGATPTRPPTSNVWPTGLGSASSQVGAPPVSARATVPRRRASWTRNKKLNAAVATLLVVSLVIRGGYALISSWSSSPSAEETALKAATQLVAESLKSPSTASYAKRTVVATDSQGHYLVHVLVDAENGFGAVLRASYLVAVKVTANDSKHFEYDPSGVAVQECGDPPSAEEVVAMKAINGW